jgi:hypothetical protein
MIPFDVPVRPPLIRLGLRYLTMAAKGEPDLRSGLGSFASAVGRSDYRARVDAGQSLPCMLPMPRSES